jgi:hypothetical protein
MGICEGGGGRERERERETDFAGKLICASIVIYLQNYNFASWACHLVSHFKEGLRVSEKSMLRRKFGPKRGEVTGGWKRCHNEELHNLYFSPNINRMTK